MDVKIISSFLLWFCLIGSLSISQTASARLDSRQRFRRQNDESIACPEGTKPCKDDNKMCVVYCNGNFECVDGSDEIDCATNTSASSLSSANHTSATTATTAKDDSMMSVSPDMDGTKTSSSEATSTRSTSLSTATNAPATSTPAEPIIIVQSTESIGIEIERANPPQATTDITTATLAEIIITEGDAGSGNGATTIPNELDATTSAGKQATIIDSDGITVLLPEGSTSIITAATGEASTAGDVVTGATVEAATAGDAVTGATVEAATAEDVVTGATVEAATAGDVVTGATVEASTAGDAVTGATVEASTAGDVATGATVEASTAGDAVTGATIEASTAGDAVTGATGETSPSGDTVTGASGENDTDVFTTPKPGNGHGTEQDNDTTTDDNTAGPATTIESPTIDTNGTETTDNGTVTDAPTDVTTILSNDTLSTVTTDGGTTDIEYDDESEESVHIQTTTTTLTSAINDNDDDDDDDAKEDYAIEDDDVITTTIVPQRIMNNIASVIDEVEYYDDPDKDNAIKDISTSTISKTTTTTTTTLSTQRTTNTIVPLVNDEVEYYDDDDDGEEEEETNVVKEELSITTTTITTASTTTIIATTTTSTTTIQQTLSVSTTTQLDAEIEYYDDSDEVQTDQRLTTTTTTATTTTTKIKTAQAVVNLPASIPNEDVEYYDDSYEINLFRSITTTTIVSQQITTISRDIADDDDDNDDDDDTEDDETSKGDQTSIKLSIPDVKNGTTPTPPQPTTTGTTIELRVVVRPEILQVQRGQTYEINCIVQGADASTNIYWIQEEPERRYALVDQPDANDKQIAMSQVSLRARITIDDPSKIGKYTCMAQDAAGNSGSAILTMQEGGYRPPPPTPGPYGGHSTGYLRIVAPDMAEGDYVEIQCEGASPEDEGRIQWFFNNELVSDREPLYPRGKTLHIRPISGSYLGSYRCSIPGSSYGDATSVLTFGGSPSGPPYGFAVTVQIVQGQTAQGQAQEGTQVILRCQASEQANGFRWTFTSNQGTVDRGYTDQLVLSRASSQDSGLYTCEATNARGQSARGSVNLYVTAAYPPSTTGQCSVDEATCRNGRCIPRAFVLDGKNDCGDNSDEDAGSSGDGCQPNEIRCTDPNRGRKCIQKFWMCDGDRDCDDGSDEEQRYCDLLPRQRYCKPSEFQCGGPNATTPNAVCIPRSFQCDGYNDCPDRSDEVGCVKPTVVAAPQRQFQINVGQTLNIQCSARGSPAPYINWRLNWGHVCGDGSNNGRCTMTQSIDQNDPSLVTGTLTVRQVNVADGGAYSCEALNNQGFVFAIPDAIVEVINGRTDQPPQTCNCYGHSTTCTTDGRCLNCQHNTVGYNCEFCAPGYQGDARRGSPQDCQSVQPEPPTDFRNCDPYGTHMERGGRCICKYNVEGDRCNQCKRGHFHLNPTTPNGCVPCFCSGVTTECTSTDWRRQPNPLPLNNWNAVPRNFATDRFEAGNRIQQRNGALSLDQSSLSRSSDETLYWKAPKENLGDVVTLYDGTIDIHFTNDGNDNQAPNDQEFIWLRGNNIDLIHKLPQSQRFKSNTNATYSVQVNERTFTRKDGTYIDRENILMALSDLDTLLIKINPIGGQKNAVLRGVTLNAATRDGYADGAPTVESCRCPANYTGSSCEKCAEGYGRPHPLIGIYLGQCWSCQSICNGRSDRCDRETGKCFDCQGNSEGDRCERCHSGYVLDARINQCVQSGQFQPDQPQPGSGIYVDQKPYGSQGPAPFTIILDGNNPEQRVPLQVLNTQPQSIVWGRADGSALPSNVAQDGNDLVFRNPSGEQGGNYIATITHPNGFVDRIHVYVEYRPGQRRPDSGYPVFSPASPLTISEGSSQLVQPQGAYYQVQWQRANGQPLPSGIYQNGNALQITGARPDHSGTYYCVVYGADNVPSSIPYEIRVRAGDRPSPSSGGPPRINIEPKVITLREGQRMIVQYTVSSHDPIEVIWNKLTGQGYQPIPSLFTVEPNRLVLNRAVPEAAGTYQVIVRNQQGEDRQDLRIIVEPRRGRGRGGQPAAGAPQIQFQQQQYEIGYGEVIDIVPNIYGGSEASITWAKDGSNYLPSGITASNDGRLRVEGQSNNIEGRYTLNVANGYGRASASIDIRWKQSNDQYGGYGNNYQDNSRDYQGSGNYNQGYGQGGDQQQEQQQQPGGYVEVTVEPNEASLARGEKATLTCRVKGAEDYTITWGKYGNGDTSLPNYARQEGNSVVIAPTDDSLAEQMYLQCSVNIRDQPQPYIAYAPLTIRNNDESQKKKKKRRS